MKKLILIICILNTIHSTSQNIHFNQEEAFKIHLGLDPGGTISDGLINANIEIEYIGFIYAKLGSQVHTGLNPNYLDIHFGIGLNLMLDKFNNYRSYIGLRGGRIYREDKARVPFLGAETGLDYTINPSISVGVRATYDHRTEGDFLGYDRFWQDNYTIRIGITI